MVRFYWGLIMKFEQEEYWVLLGGWRIGYVLSGLCGVMSFSLPWL